MKTAKEEVLEIVRDLPDESSYEDIQYHIYVRAKIEKSLADADAGRLIDHEEVERRATKWLGE
jgi:predicted transcriptional regulator